MRSHSGQTLRITQLRLENWRNFVSVDVPLARRVFLVGPNAAGKSNLLDAFWFLHELVIPNGGLQEAIRRRRGLPNLRCLSARSSEDIVIAVGIGEDGNQPGWEYRLAFTQTRRSPPAITSERITRSGETILLRPDSLDQKDPLRLQRSCMEDGAVNRPCAGLARFFESISYLHIVPQLVRHPRRTPERRRPHAGDPFGEDFLERVARTPERSRSRRLRMIADALRYAIPQLGNLEFWRDSHGAPHLRWRCEHWRGPQAWQTEEEFSDGTLRLLGLLWATLEGDGPLLLEEPELSLHPDVARYVPQMLARLQLRSGRQILMSTHSTEMLYDEGIGLDELLLLQPGRRGTSVRRASDISEIRELVLAGISLAEAAIPQTRPPDAAQLSLFPD